MEHGRVFGEIDPRANYVTRPSAYAILLNDHGRIAVVQGRTGHYLPGGGIEPGEDAERAIARECLEECGLRVRQFVWLGSAAQLLHAPGEGWFRIEGQFYFARVSQGSTEAITHEFSWVEPQVAADVMTRPFERWAIEKWLSER